MPSDVKVRTQVVVVVFLLTSSVIALLALLKNQNSTVAPESLSIRLHDANSMQPIRNFEYFLKSGRRVDGTQWDTVEKLGQDILQYDRTPPSEWKKCQNREQLEFDIASASSSLFVRSPGYEMLVVYIPTVLDQSGDIVLRARPVERITGSLVDPFGAKMSGVPIMLASLPPNFQTWDLKRFASAITDDNGGFEIDSYELNYPILVVCYTERFGPTYRYISEEEIGTLVELIYCAPASIKGNLAYSRGKVQDADVSIALLTSELEQFAVTYCKVDDLGNFIVEKLPPGHVTLSFYGTVPSSILSRESFTSSAELDLDCGEVRALEVFVGDN